MNSMPFVDAIANEKSWDALHNDKPSAKLRRMMFRGQTIFPKTSVDLGASNGLPGAIAQNMEEWGFKFERVQSEHENPKLRELGYKLINRDHVPTVRKKKYPTKRKPKPEPEAIVPSANGNGNRLRDKIRQALIDGQALSEKEAMRLFDCSTGNLRQAVNAMQREGHKFDVYQSGSGKTYALKGSGKAVAKANGFSEEQQHLPMLAGHNGIHGELGVPPTPVFGSQVQVVGQHMSRDGVVSLVLRSDEYDWLTTVDGPPQEAESASNS